MPSMNLTPIGNPAHETIRGVRFAMLGGFELLTVLVTHTALDEIEAQRASIRAGLLQSHILMIGAHCASQESTKQADHRFRGGAVNPRFGS